MRRVFNGDQKCLDLSSDASKTSDHPLLPQTMLNFEQKCVEMSPYLGTASLEGVGRMDG